jgi:GGDEF domain-containing protein
MSGSAPTSRRAPPAGTPGVLVGWRPSATGPDIESAALIYLVDGGGVIQWANPAAAALLPSDRVDGMTLAELAHVDDRHKIDRLLVGACAGRQVQALVRIKQRGSAPDPRQVLLITGDGCSTRPPRAFRDWIVVQGRHRGRWPVRLHQLPTQMSWDHRAELANWESFADRLNHELAHPVRWGHRLAILFIRIQGLAAVVLTGEDKSCAHLLGLLTWRLWNSVRPPDTLTRISRNEFTVICPDLSDAEQAMNVADRMRAAMAAPLSVAGDDIALPLSVSVAFTRYGPM